MSKKQFWTRIAAALLSIILAASGSGALAADVYTKTDMDTFAENIRFLSAFDLVADSKRDAATTIQRGDFASIMLKYLCYGRMPYEGKAFSDIPDKTDAVYSMVQLGLINGYPDGSFRPNGDVLFEEAVKIVVSALGYHTKAQTMGGYPSGYISCAQQIGLMKGIELSNGKILTYYKLSQMLVNALSVDLMQRTSLGEEDFYSVTRGTTWLSSRLKVEKRQGVVTAAQGVSLGGSGTTGKNTISVDGTVYAISGNYSELVGSYVEFYVDEDSEVHYLTQRRTTRTILKAESLLDYSGKTYRVDEAGKSVSYKLAPDAYILFNGSLAESLSTEDMLPEYGTVILVDTTDDGLYDVVWVENLEIYIVQSVNADQKRIFYKDSGGDFLDFSQVSNVGLTIVDQSQAAVPFERIPADSVIRTGFSKDGAKCKIIVSTASVSGDVTETEGAGRDLQIYIDSVPYKTVHKIFGGEEIAAGMSGVFYLDSEGLIAAFTAGDKAFTHGYLSGAMVVKGMEGILQLKIFDAQGQMLILDCASRVNIDGLKKQTAEQVLKILKKGTDDVLKQIIRFKRSSAGKVVEIDTPYNNAPSVGTGYLTALPENGESPESLRLIFSGAASYYAALYTFSGRVNISADTTIINVSNGGALDRDFRIRKVSELTNERSYTIQAYSDSADERYAKLIFMSANLDGAGGIIGVVSSVTRAIDPDEGQSFKIRLETPDGAKEYFAESALAKPYPSTTAAAVYPVEIGDIISCSYNGKFAQNLFMVYQRKTGIMPAGNPYGSLGTQDYRYIFGTPYSQEQRYINVSTADILSGATPAAGSLESHYAPAFVVLKYSELRGKPAISRAAASDIIDYKTGGTECSKVFVLTHWSWPRMIIIY